jgi:hypothetical protein
VASVRRLRELFPDQPIVGNFVARCNRPDPQVQPDVLQGDTNAL